MIPLWIVFSGLVLPLKNLIFSWKVRKANKLLGTLSGSVDQLPSKKMYSGQQIDDQKARYAKAQIDT